ncbi:MAG: 2-oxoglutarate dehydrogenase complex dihydrolipoyllysine-residue succinyltransferase [Oligoflexia bacterium]|nr:2-oxoglutarate dehydrogenase complex dihydrolipoyllysine-residue succinyltransferase [Oligoflexia bacterium]
MKVEIKVPAVGESINEATIAEWLKKDGEQVAKNDVLLSLETDKATVEVVAEHAGKLSTKAKAGDVVTIGAVVGMIDTELQGTTMANVATVKEEVTKPAAPISAPASAPASAASAPKPGVNEVLSPAVRRVVDERGLDPANISGTGKDGRITKYDAQTASAKPAAAPAAAVATAPAIARSNTPSGGERRVPMTTIRKRIAQRLVEAQHNAALLTTFNEIDMSGVMAAREKYKDAFKEKYGISLGFMGFFVKAAIHALREVPAVNAFIDKDDMIYHDYYNIGVAVGTEKGLLVPVIKNAEQLSIAGVELSIREYAKKARDGKISPADLGGGTFTISNGGVYGSLMSTPILNPPQSGILGMHKIEERPVVVDKQIVIRPMMYVALSYDHRIIDGKEAVTFLVKIKESIEDPQRILLEI